MKELFLSLGRSHKQAIHPTAIQCFLFVVIGILTIQCAQATLFMQEAFNYSTGNLTHWNSPGTGIQVTSGSLTYTGLQDLSPSGNKITITGGGARNQYTNFTISAVSSGSVYYSFLIKCTTLPTANNYITALQPSGGTGPSGSADPILLYAGAHSTSGYAKIGVRKDNATTGATYATNKISSGTVYLVVLKYTFNTSSSSDDVASLYINPTPGGSEPATPDATQTGGTDAANLQVVGFKAQAATTQGNWEVDTLRIGSTWEDVTPASSTTATTTTITGSNPSTPSTYGQQITFTASVSPTPPDGGTVNFYDGGTGGTLLGSGTLTSGTATYQTTVKQLNVGTHNNIVARYSGGSGYGASTSASFTQVVNAKSITVTAVTDSKPYDGTTTSSVAPTISPGLVSGDTSGFTQSFDSPVIGTGKTLTPSGSVNDDNSGNNYSVTFVPVYTGVIYAYPPVANSDTVYRLKDNALTILKTDLLANDNANGFPPIGWGGLGNGGITMNGVVLSSDSAHIYYTNSQNVSDSFSYWITNYAGLAATNLVSIFITTNVFSQNTPTVTVSGGAATVGFGEVPGYFYEVQRATNVQSTNWVVVATTNAPDNLGFFEVADAFEDLGTSPLQAFYRLRFVAFGEPVTMAPVIHTQPANQTVYAGQSATFSVLAGGTPQWCQWYFSPNTLLANQTNATLVLNNVQTNDAGGYFVIVTNNLGSATSVVATLTVNLPTAPTISTNPENQTVIAGQSAAFTAAATGLPSPSYQWYFNTNTLLNGEINATLTLNNVQTNNAGGYSVVAANVGGSVTSAVATLTVLVPPWITAQPQDQSIEVGQDATFTVAASGIPSPGYQWYFNTNTLLVGATNATLTITNAQTTNAGTYFVVAANSAASATSVLATLTVEVVTFYVSPTGNDTNSGTIDSPFQTISKGLSTVGNGGTLYLRGGTYSMTSKLSLTRTANPTNMIRIWAYPGETPVIDNTGIGSGIDGISISGDWYYLKGIEQKNAAHNGIKISGNSNIVENCVIHANGDTGLHISGGDPATSYPAYNLILNCDSYFNFNSPVGDDADGFAAKWALGPGNVFRGCRSWNNSDDGWDLWMGSAPVSIENCWAFRNGVDSWHTGQVNGNGNGFKLGGNDVATSNYVANCVSFDNAGNTGRGFDENNNLAGQTLYNCTAYRNGGDNYHFANTVTTGQHIIRNCISYDGSIDITSGTRDHNSWQGFTVTDADFSSLDTSLATVSRNADGRLPTTALFRLAATSSMIDAGVDVGLPYNGTAPDLGAFEYSEP